MHKATQLMKVVTLSMEVMVKAKPMSMVKAKPVSMVKVKPVKVKKVPMVKAKTIAAIVKLMVNVVHAVEAMTLRSPSTLQ